MVQTLRCHERLLLSYILDDQVDGEETNNIEVRMVIRTGRYQVVKHAAQSRSRSPRTP